MSHRLIFPLALAPLATLMACMFLTFPCKAEEPTPDPNAYPQKTARYSIEVKKETYLEMLSSLPETKISANREKIIEALVRHIGRNAQEIAADRHAVIAAEICDKTILPLLTPRIEQFNSIMVSAATADKVSAGFLAFKGLAAGMAEGDDLSGVTVYGNFIYLKPSTAGAPELDWKWETNLVGSKNSTLHLSAKIDETPTVDLKAHGVDKSFDFPITCEGKVSLKKAYQEQYCLFENPRGKAKTSVSLTPEVEITASKSMESNYQGFFKVEGEERISVSKTIKYDAALLFEFDAAPPSE